MRLLPHLVLVAGIFVLTAALAPAQEGDTKTFGKASDSMMKQLEAASAELDALRKKISDEKLPLMQRLSKLEAELVAIKAEERAVLSEADSGVAALQTYTNEIKRRTTEVGQLSKLLEDYARAFETASLHIAEKGLYAEPVKKAALALENTKLADARKFDAQIELFETTLARLEELAGGRSFAGSAVGPDGILRDGTFTLVGPIALYRSRDGKVTGTVEERLNAEEPRVQGFAREEDRAAAARSEGGTILVDTSLGNAHKVAETEDSLLDEIKKGGPVMYPIIGMAGLALLIATIKWISFLFVRKPAKKHMKELRDAIDAGDATAARSAASRMRGPIGRMLFAGTEHIEEPRDLIEEVMYEHVLTTRLKLNRMLPFIAICAASAPLLGLLGTVSGIINTFKVITVSGAGDVGQLSGGISEALITTKFGLIVAIPSLLLHAFLSRQAKGMMGKMEASAVTFANAVSTSPFRTDERDPRLDLDGDDHPRGPDRGQVKEQVSDVLREMLGGTGASKASARTETRALDVEGGAATGEAHV